MPDNTTAPAPVMPPVAPVQDAAIPPVAPLDPTAPAPVDFPTVASSSAVVAPTAPVPGAATTPPNPEIPSEVARKISESRNVLIALSSDPSVDELAAAIGLSIYLDRLGKRATAIYSGSTPNALEFLKPEETFESTADTLQDFVIALNKDKADHLRYKLDGDYVKIYITPYRHRLSEEDLEFSYGDFNVDLVLALDVANGIDLDSALREHGRIMHDASIINITTGNPGKFGEIEWSDKSASSVSEMIAKLLYNLSAKVKIEKEESTAFLTGIVAATNRFSNAHTTPETMKLASRLMESGANQQLISKNITPDIDNEMFSLLSTPSSSDAPRDTDPTKLDIEHGNEEGVDETKEISDTITEKESTLLDDLKAAEESLAHAGAETTPDLSNQPVKLDEAVTPEAASAAFTESAPTTPEIPPVPLDTITPPAASDSADAALPPVAPFEPSVAPSATSDAAPEDPTSTTQTEAPSADGLNSVKPEKVIAPPADFTSDFVNSSDNKYGKMLEDALASVGGPSAPTEPASPIMSTPDVVAPAPDITAPAAPVLADNPAAMSAPSVPTNPEINGVPSINYMPMPGEEVLPPPPAPPIDMSTTSPAAATPAADPIAPAMPATDPTTPAPTSLGPQPAMQDQVYAPQATDPSAFKIPGM